MAVAEGEREKFSGATDRLVLSIWNMKLSGSQVLLIHSLNDNDNFLPLLLTIDSVFPFSSMANMTIRTTTMTRKMRATAHRWILLP